MSGEALANLQLLKNAIAACVLPPGPLLVLAIAGAWVARRGRRPTGIAMTIVAAVLVWAASCVGVAAWLERTLLSEPPALTETDRGRLAAAAAQGEPAAIVILGGGLTSVAPEYGRPTPTAAALERVRYGAWLSRATGLPIAISGGTGWAAPQAQANGQRPPSESDIMGDIASREFGCPVRWRESASRDTRENARNTVALLGPQGIRTLVLVTDGWHMPRALREFRAAAAQAAPSLPRSVSSPVAPPAPTASPPMRIVAAPMGQAGVEVAPPLEWMPSSDGDQRVRQVLREAIGLLLAP